MNRILTGTTTPGQSGLGGNGKVRVLHSPQTSKTSVSRSESVDYPRKNSTFVGNVVVPLFKGKASRLGL